MDTRRTVLIAALTLAAALSLKTAEAAAARLDTKAAVITVSTPAPPPAVVVKIGDALLEEYRAGDPSRRTVFVRQDDSARRLARRTDPSKQHS